MRRLTVIAVLTPLTLLSGCNSLSLPHLRPYERTTVLRPTLATAQSPLIAANTLRSREAEEGASGAMLEPPAEVQDQRVDLVQQRDDGLTRVVDGTSLLARANFAGNYSAAFTAGREQVRESSPDVQDLAGGIYSENRTRYGLELAAREGRGRYSLAYLRDSSDDDATKTLRVGLTQKLFHDQTRLTLAWDRTAQDLERRGDATFRGTNERRGYVFGVSHLLTKRLELSATVEGRTATGYLADPTAPCVIWHRPPLAAMPAKPSAYRTSAAATPLPYAGAMHLREIAAWAWTTATTKTTGVLRPTRSRRRFSIRWANRYCWKRNCAIIAKTVPISIRTCWPAAARPRASIPATRLSPPSRLRAPALASSGNSCSAAGRVSTAARCSVVSSTAASATTIIWTFVADWPRVANRPIAAARPNSNSVPRCNFKQRYTTRRTLAGPCCRIL